MSKKLAIPYHIEVEAYTGVSPSDISVSQVSHVFIEPEHACNPSEDYTTCMRALQI